LLFALGEGTFMTGSAVFFTQLVGLSRMAQRFLEQEGLDPHDFAPPEEASSVIPAPSLLEDPPLSPAGDGFGPPTAQR
jgi:hypothetical protein